jgi:hypothetical protein
MQTSTLMTWTLTKFGNNGTIWVYFLPGEHELPDLVHALSMRQDGLYKAALSSPNDSRVVRMNCHLAIGAHPLSR